MRYGLVWKTPFECIGGVWREHKKRAEFSALFYFLQWFLHRLERLERLQTIETIMQTSAKRWAERRFHRGVLAIAMRTSGMRQLVHVDVTVVLGRRRQPEILDDFFSLGADSVGVPLNIEVGFYRNFIKSQRFHGIVHLFFHQFDGRATRKRRSHFYRCPAAIHAYIRNDA